MTICVASYAFLVMFEVVSLIKESNKCSTVSSRCFPFDKNLRFIITEINEFSFIMHINKIVDYVVEFAKESNNASLITPFLNLSRLCVKLSYGCCIEHKRDSHVEF